VGRCTLLPPSLNVTPSHQMQELTTPVITCTSKLDHTIPGLLIAIFAFMWKHCPPPLHLQSIALLSQTSLQLMNANPTSHCTIHAILVAQHLKHVTAAARPLLDVRNVTVAAQHLKHVTAAARPLLDVSDVTVAAQYLQCVTAAALPLHKNVHNVTAAAKTKVMILIVV
jgi:hypothetical protein